MSKITILHDTKLQIGVPLSKVEFGTLVRRTTSDLPYLVVSPMDGSGACALVTIGGGILKEVPQDLEVLPLSATLIVHGVDATTVAGAS